MIRSYFGLQRSPFDAQSVTLLPHQQEVFDILRVHAQQGGLCLVLGEPGTGKSVLKETLLHHDLRKLRLLCEDFPRSHNLVLIGQPPLLQSLSLTINEEIRSRVTYSALLPRLAPEAVEQFVLDQLDR